MHFKRKVIVFSSSWRFLLNLSTISSMRVLLQNHASPSWSLMWYQNYRLIAWTWLTQLVESQFVRLYCQNWCWFESHFYTIFFINVKKVKRQFLGMFGNVWFVLICIFKPFFFLLYQITIFFSSFSNHYFSFPTLKITTEAVSPFGNTFNLFNEWKKVI